MSYAPKEPEALINRERGLFVGYILGAGAYGVLLTLFVQCISALTQTKQMKRVRWGLVAYVFFMFALGNVGYFTHLKFVQSIFIDNRNFPGGLLAWDAANYSSVINVSGIVAYFMMNWMADSLVLYRLYVIWNRRLIVVALPTAMFATSFSLSIVELYNVTQPGASMFSDSAINFGLLYWSFSVSLNILVTLLIVARLLYMRRQLTVAMAPEQARVYISISAMLIESAALYSCTAIVFLIGYARQSPVQFAVEAVELIQGVCPFMIILRVAHGNAFNSDTLRVPESAVEFSTGNGSATRWQTSQLNGSFASSSYNMKALANHQITFAEPPPSDFPLKKGVAAEPPPGPDFDIAEAV
ncbi:hypothetical protein EVG20_g5311 [Dentipellis fragilis]|uniref:Uncharacterized protein n=1 Tax=Dentipellis fragilis TaxID=205917 RepID=A0A4Y9YVN3_9AGAM|nr:hypothetical protein EVG20_g5311 [Dentipellis fragilis]